MYSNKRRALISAGIILALTLILVVNASYAWLGVSRVPFVSDVAISVITENALLLAPDIEGEPGEWSTSLDASAYLKDIVPLKPVTYNSGEFYKMSYDSGDRTAGVIPVLPENVNVIYPENSSPAARAAAEELGYMAKFDFWMKCEGANGAVKLEEAMETADGQMGPGTYVVGAPVWDGKITKHTNGGYGTEGTIRFGFEITPTDLEGNVKGETYFVMYEPNANLHANGSTGYITTSTVNGNNMVDSEHHIIQNASTWSETTPVLQDAVVYTAGEFVQNPTLVTLDTTGMAKITMDIWMEGQDVDCSELAVRDAVEIIARFQFGVETTAIETGIGRRD